ncbi:MAG: hypothetical protein BMS9Abin09_0458 [Gammaproteobacteria bacterium]|nr:MAG: hypothetical protein BMS9Abin09_0458 [Gammaproteobacteria bacterium]
MRKITVGLLIFLTGLGLGWYTRDHWRTEPIQSAQSAIPAPSKPVSVGEPAVERAQSLPARVDDIASLLKRGDFGAVLERYEVLQVQAGDAAQAHARDRILSHARLLIADSHFSQAEQLLQLFLVTAYRDVEARILLAAAYQGQDKVRSAIDALYEARGYAFRPATLQRITRRIRNTVAELVQSLKRDNNKNALLALYQQLTQLEPDHAPWFMGLAATQLALDDKEAARRSFLLVSEDPDVGAQAQAMLAELGTALADTRDTAPRGSTAEVVGIPLHRSGNNFVVDARPADGRSIRLLIDTGASLTIFTPGVLEQRGIRYQDTGRTGVFNTANGLVRAPVYKLDALLVGDWQVSQLEIGVLELGGSSAIDGLLGMNFLKHFQFFIDQNEAMLRLSINQDDS